MTAPTALSRLAEVIALVPIHQSEDVEVQIGLVLARGNSQLAEQQLDLLLHGRKAALGAFGIHSHSSGASELMCIRARTYSLWPSSVSPHHS